jgi:hypothetical protein
MWCKNTFDNAALFGCSEFFRASCPRTVHSATRFDTTQQPCALSDAQQTSILIGLAIPLQADHNHAW